MRASSDLKDYQLDIVKAVINRKQLCVFSKPGSGKTAAVLYGVKKLNPFRTLIVAPKFVCQTVWRQEAEQWVGLRHLVFTLLCQPKAQRDKLMFERTHFHLINYELITKLVDAIKEKGFKLSDWYDCIIFDEVSNLKSPGTKRFRSLRRQILNVPYRIGMTGTPIGNSYLNLWGEIYMCAGNKYVESTFTQYKNKYFLSDYNGWKWELKPKADELIQNKIQPCSIVVQPKNIIPREFLPVNYRLPSKIVKDYNALVNEFVIALEHDDGVMVVGGHAAVVKNKLRQMESGAIYKTAFPGEECSGEWIHLHNQKTERLANLIDSLQGAQTVIAYAYKHELDRIMDLGLDVAWIKQNGVLDNWLAGKVQCLAIHPASAGHGLNLHLNGCFNMVFFTMPWSYELFEQTIGRLTRIGQKNTVSIYYFAGPPVENQVFDALTNHRKVEQTFLQEKNSCL